MVETTPKVDVMETKDSYSPPRPRRFVFADSPKSGGSRSARANQANVLGAEFRNIISKSNSKDEEDVVKDRISVHRSGSGGSPSRSRSSGSRGSQAKSRSSGSRDPSRRQQETVISVTHDARSVISDLSGSRGPPPRGPPPPRKSGKTTITDSDTKKTTGETTFLESMIENICNYCGGFETGGNPTSPSKEERKEAADDTFLGKIITCHPCVLDMDDFGCVSL